MIFPVEIVELILLKCDGKTLLNVRRTCNDLRDTVDYLGKRTKIWEWCCKEEIPREQLVEYLSIYEGDGKEKWENMYINWSVWEKYSSFVMEPLLCANELKKISSIAVSSNHIAVGSEDGRVKLFTRHWKPVFEYRIAAVKLTNLAFIGYHDLLWDTCLLVAFHKGISLLTFNGIRKYQYDIRDVLSHSIYGNHICIEKVGGRLTILEINKGLEGRQVKEIWFTRIYSPSSITSYKMWNGKCTFLTDGSIYTLDYDKPDITPMENMKRKIRDINFFSSLMLDSSTTQILRDNVIINIYRNADKTSRSPDILDDYIEIIIMGPGKKYSKKLFNMWEIFTSKITCVYLYGNSFVLGTDCGTVYFYRLNNWKNFELNKYDSKQIVGKHPIIGIAAVETQTARKFYVCSKFAIHEIICWIPFRVSTGQ